MLEQAHRAAARTRVLTPREEDVLRNVAEGLTNAEVAERLDVTVHAVKFHLSSIYRKLDVANRTEAAVAFQLGHGRSDPPRDIASAPTGLEEAHLLLELPTDRPRPAVRGGRVGLERRILPLSLRRSLETFAADRGIALRDVLLTGFGIVLARYSGQHELTVGFGVHPQPSGREFAFDPSFIPVRLDLAGRPTFTGATLRTAHVLADSDQRGPRAGMRDQPVSDRHGFQVLCEVRVQPDVHASLPAEAQAADLGLVFSPCAEGIEASACFDEDLFDAPTITRFLGHVESVLAAGAAEGNTDIALLPLLQPSERRRLIDEWNATEAQFPSDRCLHELFVEQARVRPGATAVVDDDGELSYGELDRRSNRLAHRLLELGVGRDDLVGICAGRSRALLVGLLGILKAGAAYVPVDPTYPAARQRFMLEDAQAAVVVTEERWLADLPSGGAAIVCLDRDWQEIERRPSVRPAVKHDPEQLAYVIYTSGSTGQPKGVQIPHRALVNFLTTMGERPGLGSDDVLLAVTTLSFDIAGLELYLPLVQGARVVVAAQAASSDPRRLAELLERHAVTVMQATPTTWRMLVDSGWTGRPGLRVLCGGEALPLALADELLDRGLELWNMYGPTETTIWSTAARVTTRGQPLTIGRPIANTTLYVLDENLQPTPIGVPGELHIGGAGLARGYRGRPDLTAERFTPHPFDEGGRLYKTGDLVRYRGDGNVEFLGRLDHQVKVRGFRIELGEIETVLSRHEGVSGAVVTVREDDPQDPRLVAYVVPRDGKLSAPELRRFAGEALPAYMVPSSIVSLRQFPLTPNGKVDRKALPAPSTERSTEHEAVAARTVLEERLVRIWEEVLDVHPIGVTDDFWDLGATSIVAARLFARIEKELGNKLPLAPVFQAPTIERLAQLIDTGSRRSRWSSLVPIQPRGSKPPIFCVHGGAGTILHLQRLARALGPEQPFYALQARGLYGEHPALTSVEEMASHYISEIRTVKPEGPYTLAGYCFGAIVAFEMAQQLTRAGEEVPFVAIFNGPSPLYIRTHGTARRLPTVPRVPLTRRQRVLRLLREPGRLVSWSAWMYRRERARVIAKVQDAQVSWHIARGRPLPERLRDFAFIRISWSAERTYAPTVFPGRLLLFYGEGLYRVPSLGWDGLGAGGVDSIEVAGEHEDNRTAMREPHVSFIAERLQEHLPADEVAALGGPS